MRRGFFRYLWCVFGLLAVLPGRLCIGQALNPVQVGCNLEKIRDWSRSHAFVDVVKQSRGFLRADTGFSVPATLNAQGWPTEDFDIILMTDTQDVLGLSGTYKVSGQCSVAPQISVVGNGSAVTNVQYVSLTQRFTADVTLPASAEEFFLKFRATSGGVVSLKVLRPGYSTTNTPVFTTPFLAHIARFNQLRVMDWTQTNNTLVSNWANRTSVAAPSYSTNDGAPWEVCADLANIAGKDLWINVPHLADDVYITNLATLLRDRLDPLRKVYVEHSNEVWNPLFQQHAWNNAAALAAPGSLGLSYDGQTAPILLAARHHAFRTHRIAEIFASVYGPALLKERVRVVLAGQQSEPALLFTGLDYLNHFYGPPKDYLYAVAGAPYFGLGDLRFVDGLTPNQIIDALRTDVNSLPVRDQYEQNARMASWFELPFIAYEGGSDTAGSGSLESKRLATMDPRMYDLCVDYLHEWFSWGFGEFQWFTGGATSWRAASGAWGLTEDMLVQNTYRILAVDDTLTMGVVPVTRGLIVPGTIDARRHVDRPANWELLAFPLDDLSLGEEFDYVINSPQGAIYRARIAMGCDSGNQFIGVYVNGQFVTNAAVPMTGSHTTLGYSSTISLPLKKGMNVLRLRVLGQGQYSIGTVNVLCPLDLDDNGNIADGLLPDGGVDINDLLAFLALFEIGNPSADVDNDGVQPQVLDSAVDINDLLYFIVQFEAGC